MTLLGTLGAAIGAPRLEAPAIAINFYILTFTSNFSHSHRQLAEKLPF